MTTLDEEVAAVGRLSAHAAKYGGQWLPEDHAVLRALLRRVGQEAGESWVRTVGFRVYVVVRAVPGSTTGASVLGVASSHEAALALAPGADWCPIEGGGHLVAYTSTEPHLSCWELLIGGTEEAERWIFAD